jgi:hypothetical protein
MLTAPFANDPAVARPPRRAAVVGLAAGTIPKQLTQVYGPLPIDGIELDPAIVEVGRDFFALNEPNIQILVGDGRYELNQLAGPYDLITLDAYKVPYIPWHLATRDFFDEVKARLTPEGVLAVNVGRVPDDRRLVEAINATLQSVFPTVITIDVPGSLNSILFATAQPARPGNLSRNAAGLPTSAHPLLAESLRVAAANEVASVASNVVFTDQRAPLETMVDSIVIGYILRQGPSGLPGFQQ